MISGKMCAHILVGSSFRIHFHFGGGFWDQHLRCPIIKETVKGNARKLRKQLFLSRDIFIRQVQIRFNLINNYLHNFSF